MNACREFRESLSMALDEALGKEDERRLREHLSGCAACRVFQRDLAEAHRLVRSVEAVEPPPWMASKIMARIRAETAPRPGFWRRAVLPLITRPQFQVATVLLVCATSYLLVKSRSGPSGDEVMRGIRQPPAEVQGKVREAEALGPAKTPQAAPPESLRAPAAERLRESDEPAPRLEYNKQQKGKGSFAPPPAPAPQAEIRDAVVAQKPASPESPAVAGSVAGGASGREERMDIARTSKKAAAPAIEQSRDDKEAKQDAATQNAPLLVLWNPEQPDRARQLLEQELADLGASLAPEGRVQGQGLSQAQSQARMLSARMDGRRLPELLARLGRLGTVKTSQTQQQGPQTGEITILIRW